jgi:DNA-directed RNA polymerase subunit RPC12/RpoP
MDTDEKIKELQEKIIKQKENIKQEIEKMVKAKNTCKKCGSKKMIETITQGMVQKVWWDGVWIVKEETTYNKNSKGCSYTCADCGAEWGN